MTLKDSVISDAATAPGVTPLSRERSRGLRVALFSPHYPGVSGVGGIGTYTRTLAEGLAETGHQSHVLTEGPPTSSTTLNRVPVHVIGTRSLRLVERLVPGFSRSWMIAARARRLVVAEKIDIVEFPNWEGLGIGFAVRRRVPLVVRLHTSAKESQQIDNLPASRHVKWDIRREQLQARLADALVTHSHAHRRNMAIELNIDPETIAVVPHGIRASPSFQRSSSENSELTVVFLGRLERRKGTQVLLNAIPRVLTQLPKVRFVLIGHDRPHCRGGRTHRQYALDEYPPEMIKQVSFVANAPEDEVNWQLQHADVFVAPSLYESFGLVFLEAMRWGTPAIGTTAGGIPEIIEHGKSGVLVTPGDDEGLASAMIGLLRDRQQREKLGESGRRRVEAEFTADVMARRMADFYQQVISTYRPD